MRSRRFKLSFGQKVGLWIAIAFLTWHALQDPFVLEAILMFGLAGAVPGTNITLSPDQVILLAGCAVLAIFGIIIVRSIFAARRRDGQGLPAEHLPHAPSIMRRLVVRPRLYRHHVSARQDAPAIAHRTWIGRIVDQVINTAKRGVPYIVWGGAVAVWLFATMLMYVQKACLVAIAWLVYGAKRLWQWTSPHLWRFDAWLGAQFHANTRKAHHQLQANDTASVLLDIAKQGKRTVQDATTRYRR